MTKGAEMYGSGDVSAGGVVPSGFGSLCDSDNFPRQSEIYHGAYLGAMCMLKSYNQLVSRLQGRPRRRDATHSAPAVTPIEFPAVTGNTASVAPLASTLAQKLPESTRTSEQTIAERQIADQEKLENTKDDAVDFMAKHDASAKSSGDDGHGGAVSTSDATPLDALPLSIDAATTTASESDTPTPVTDTSSSSDAPREESPDTESAGPVDSTNSVDTSTDTSVDTHSDFGSVSVFSKHLLDTLPASDPYPEIRQSEENLIVFFEKNADILSLVGAWLLICYFVVYRFMLRRPFLFALFLFTYFLWAVLTIGMLQLQTVEGLKETLVERALAAFTLTRAALIVVVQCGWAWLYLVLPYLDSLLYVVCLYVVPPVKHVFHFLLKDFLALPPQDQWVAGIGLLGLVYSIFSWIARIASSGSSVSLHVSICYFERHRFRTRPRIAWVV